MLEADLVLIGTGVAPLVAASRLISKGVSVALLNPEWDFFREHSELSFDPFLPSEATPARLLRNSQDHALSVLRPDYPGAIEVWPLVNKGFQDPAAPHVRSRDRLWLSVDPHNKESFEKLFVESEDSGFHPKHLQGLAALHEFPGFNYPGRVPLECEGIRVPKMVDVDVARYRNGLLEYVRDRLGDEGVIMGASDIDLTQDGVQWRARDKRGQIKIRKGLLVFWTPRVHQWILSQLKKHEVSFPKEILPQRQKLWEKWTLASRDPIPPHVLGVFEKNWIWGDLEHSSDGLGMYPLKVLREANEILRKESFDSVSKLFRDLLQWDRFSVRSVEEFRHLDWNPDVLQAGVFEFFMKNYRATAVFGSDGPLIQVVERVQAVVDEVLE